MSSIHASLITSDADGCLVASAAENNWILTLEALAKLGQTVTPAKAGVQKSIKNLDSVFQRNDEEALLQKAL